MPPTNSGPKNATTDSRGLRTYNWRGQDLVSVTSLRRLTGVPFPLANWMMEQVIAAALKHSQNLSTMAVAEGEDVAKAFLRKASMSERDDAANRGTAVHAAAALKVDPDTIMDQPDIALPLIQYQNFLKATGAVEVMSERQVFNLTLGYAGSLDVGLRFPDKRLLVTDLKTGKGLYLDHALQLIAYAMGEFIGEDDVIDEEATKLLHSANGLALLHLSSTDWELVEIKPTPELFSVFRAMTEFAHWQRATSLNDLVVRRISS